MWSAALDAILTTLRYLAPATLLTLFWGQQSFLFKILKHIDSAFRAIVFSSEEQKQAVLLWLAEAGPVRVEHLDTVWKHGWILCGVLDAALPGSCAGHPPTRLSLKHAQAIADHYLGVEPVFSRQELESNDSLSKHQEWKLATYLERIREALAKLTPPVSKVTPQKTSPETTQFTLDYVAKGSGLTAAQINNKMYFKIYPTSQQSLDPGEITILIRGPKDTYGMTVLPPLLGKTQLIRQKMLGLQSQSFTENVLPITQGATYLRSYGKNDMNKTYYIPKTKYDIDINVETKSDHMKVSYEVNLEGKYEIFITSRGQNIVGSPFMVTASHNILGLLERDSFCLEDGEEIGIVDVENDRKVVLRIVDFVTEKMLLQENGSLEKISDEEANRLMGTDSLNKTIFKPSEIPEPLSKEEHSRDKPKKFNKAANKIIKMKRVCKIMNDLVKQSQIEQDASYMQAKTQQYIPDIVNSTFSDINTNPFIMNEKRNKYIVPESISVSLRTEKSIPFIEEMSQESIESIRSVASYESESNKNTPDSLETSNTSQEDLMEDDISIDRMTPLSGNNPFLSDISEENFIKEKDLGTFVTSEYETNNSQNEETENSSIKIMIDTHCTPPVSPNNPFIDEDVRDIVRPKTPVFKTILEQSQSLDETVHPKYELIPEEMLGNEFVNPFFTHHHHQPHEQLPITDFIIGAPVSLPPILRASSPEPQMRSLIITRNEKSDSFKTKEQRARNNAKVAEVSPSVHKISFEPSLESRKESSKTISSVSPTFQSFESNLTEHIETSTTSSVSDGNYELYKIESIQERNLTPRKETWDSAYVSIDDTNNSPDNNNNENTAVFDTSNKQKVSPSEQFTGFKQDELNNMGPAEREIWQICNELNEPKAHEDIKPHKMEVKRPSFTPILEETDKIILSGTKDIIGFEKDHVSDPVTVAFTELNNMYTEYFPGSETESTTVASEDNKLHSMELDYTVDDNKISVDSASEKLSDVKRHVDQIEGTISEVQSNVAESVSVSQTLQDDRTQSHEYPLQNKDETQFGDSSKSNIVLERKKYWDEKIRQIEAKSQETSIVHKKKRVTAKQMKHDSLSKRKGKQMIKNFLNAGGYQNIVSQTSDEKQKEGLQPEPTIQKLTELQSTDNIPSDEKLVEKWKKYWDDKLEKEHIEIEAPCLKSRTPTSKEHSVSPKQIISSETTKASLNMPTMITSDVTVTALEGPNDDDPSSPVKQELPEELFKAFETSPKRFFGTSRKQILNKIDSFTGRSTSSEESSPEVSEVSYDTGLVSSRISLFHNLSHTEELPWARRKSKSMQNIYQRKSNDKYDASPDIKLSVSQENENVGIISEQNIISKTKGTIEKASEQESNITLKEKRARILNQTCNFSIDDVSIDETPSEFDIVNESSYITKSEVLRRKSFSKSEMDIFNKIPNELNDDYLDKYKSCDELPKINVKNFISLYESVSKTAIDPKPPKQVYRTSSVDSDKLLQNISKTRDAVKEHDETEHRTKEIKTPVSSASNKLETPRTSPKKIVSYKSVDTVDSGSIDKSETESLDIKVTKDQGKETTYISLSDIELEIVESSPDKTSESSPERVTVAEHVEYKNRFKMAKQYFQSLEELREVRKPRKLNECEMLLKQSSESPENEAEFENSRPRRKKKLKSHSMPSSEISKVWSQLQDNQQSESEAGSSKLVKISEKFNVDDLFSDVMEGKLSRQGSLRGIPHKKAVLEAFRSMENIANQINSYEITDTQLKDFANENRSKSAQTYLSEYPYLPTTDPSKYQSRLDVKASGLISFKELLGKRPRRNSVPDLRLNPKFEVNL
ncbi:uncharacterized protein LOC115454534 isoform X3 [Manduca sexta]|nr:uncharacterized protein LOC115454534 isoform X3 [Manduca sexta]